MSEPEAAPDPAKMPMADLADLVNQTEPEIFDEPVVPESEEDEPAGEPTEEAQAEQEDAPTEEEPEAAAPKDQEDKKETGSEPPPSDLPEHVRLRLEAAEAERKKFEALAGRHAGELGFLRSKIKEFEQRLSARTQEGDDTSETQSATEMPPKSRDPFAQWAIQQAIAQSVSSFSAKYKDAEALAPQIQEYWKETGFNAGALAEAPDPMTAQRDTTEALELAYLHVLAKSKYEQAEAAEKEASRRNVDEAAKLAGRRRAVAATPTGGVRAAVPRKTQDPRTMPLNDLKRMIERVGAGTE